MLMSYRPQSYSDFKTQRFELYQRKINAILLNINQTSLEEKDKSELKKILAKTLLEN